MRRPSTVRRCRPGQLQRRAPGLHDLHVGLDRDAEGRGATRMRACTTGWPGCRRPTSSTPDDAVLQKTPFGFDVSVWEFFWPLMVGARLVVARPGAHRDPARLVETIASTAGDDAALRAVDAAGVCRALASVPDAVRGCASLRRLICSGEALPAELAGRCAAAVAGCAAGEPVRPDRSLDRRDALVLRGRHLAAMCRSGARSGTRGPTCWTPASSLFRLALWASFTSRGLVLRGVT